ncbi:MAG: hypothetical protein JXI32_08110 [Deltaproteobacteria bacterium]|nr:hypothetical protein [Deltaproteobacteria bacterium]
MNGISTSKNELKIYFTEMARRIRDTYGIDVWFAEITGKRWSYLAGGTGEEESLLPARRIELTDRFGIISDGWDRIPADESEAIISSFRKAVEDYG